MLKSAALALFWVPLFALAQSSDRIPESAKSALAKDLQQLQQSIAAAQSQSGEIVQDKYRIVASDNDLNGSAPLVDITKSSAPVKAGASKFAKTLVSAEQGEQYKVVDKVGDWYAVQLKNPTDNLSTGWINAAYLAPANKFSVGIQQAGAANAVSSEGVFETIIRSASEMKDKYKDNPYFSVSGFTVNVGFPPSVSMQFQFKK